MNLFLTSLLVMAVLHNIPWEKEKNVEVLTYLTYSNNNRKQTKKLSSDEHIVSICNCYGCASSYPMTERKTEKC